MSSSDAIEHEPAPVASKRTSSVKKLVLLVTCLSLILLGAWGLRYAIWVRSVNQTLDFIWQGKLDKARDSARQSISLMAVVPDNKSFALSLRMIISMYACRRLFKQAEQYNARLLDFDRKVWGEKSAEYAGDLTELALMKRKQRQFAESERLYKKAIAIYESCHADEAETARMRALLAWVLFQQGKTDEAKQELAKSDLVLKAKFGEQSFERLVGLIETEHINLKTGLKQIPDSLTIYKIICEPKELEKSSAQVVVVLTLYAQMLADANENEKADKIFCIAENNCKSSVFGGAYNMFMADILESHAALLARMGRRTESQVLQRRAAEIRKLILS